jgi:hypothetical protein
VIAVLATTRDGAGLTPSAQKPTSAEKPVSVQRDVTAVESASAPRRDTAFTSFSQHLKAEMSEPRRQNEVLIVA